MGSLLERVLANLDDLDSLLDLYAGAKLDHQRRQAPAVAGSPTTAATDTAYAGMP